MFKYASVKASRSWENEMCMERKIQIQIQEQQGDTNTNTRATRKYIYRHKSHYELIQTVPRSQ